MLPVATGPPTLVLDEGNINEYLRRRGLLAAGEEAIVSRLSGGYVNNVFRADRVPSPDRPSNPGRPATTSPGSLVLKQSLAGAQRTVLAADIRRGLAEVAAMKTIKSALGPLAPIPTIVEDDPANYVSIMTAAPTGARLYETELLAGRFPPGTGALLGTYAAHLHARTDSRTNVAAAFADNPGFALRDQSIRSAARANPELAPLIEEALRRNRDEARVLVDADITPKNVLVHPFPTTAQDRPAGAAGDKLAGGGRDGPAGGIGITKLDFECTQWGHPALDVGIIVAHYILLAFARPQWRDPLLAEGEDCYRAYTAVRPEARSRAFAADVGLYTAVMMLGRADGDLVFDYLIPHRRAVRALAADFCTAVRSPADLIAHSRRLLPERTP